MAVVKPVLRAFDYDKVIQFYIDWLEFKVDWESRPENTPFYMQISRGDIMLEIKN